MTKADRAEHAARLRALPHYRRLAEEQCLHYGLTTKKDQLARWRAEAAAAQHEED